MKTDDPGIEFDAVEFDRLHRIVSARRRPERMPVIYPKVRCAKGGDPEGNCRFLGGVCVWCQGTVLGGYKRLSSQHRFQNGVCLLCGNPDTIGGDR